MRRQSRRGEARPWLRPHLRRWYRRLRLRFHHCCHCRDVDQLRRLCLFSSPVAHVWLSRDQRSRRFPRSGANQHRAAPRATGGPPPHSPRSATSSCDSPAGARALAHERRFAVSVVEARVACAPVAARVADTVRRDFAIVVGIARIADRAVVAGELRAVGRSHRIAEVVVDARIALVSVAQNGLAASQSPLSRQGSPTAPSKQIPPTQYGASVSSHWLSPPHGSPASPSWQADPAQYGASMSSQSPSS